MFYFNRQSKAYQKNGLIYSPPFGMYTIVSGSMVPSINVYDVVVSVNIKDPSDIKPGDVITYVSNWDLNYGLNITHRVIRTTRNEHGEYFFITKGDNNQEVDGAPVPHSNVVGKVIMRIPQLGRLQFFLSTKIGWFVVVFIPAILVIIYDIIKIIKLTFLKRKTYEVRDSNEVEFKDLPKTKDTSNESSIPIKRADANSERKMLKRKEIVRMPIKRRK